jgi:hypothetical protein
MGSEISIADIGSPVSFGTFFLMAIWVIRTWPHWKAKVNEARKIQLDADSDRLSQAFTRIRVLEEAQSADRRDFNEEMSKERKRCDDELDEIRERLTASEQREQGLLAMIRQNSQSTAQMIGRPDAVAESAARRAGRGDNVDG